MIRSGNFSANIQKYGAGIQQVRCLKRKAAYPEAYIPKVPSQSGKKDHSSYFQRSMRAWLGPKNVRGEYYRNKYYYPPQDHKSNYIVQDGKSVAGAEEEQAETRRFNRNQRDPSLHPFPENVHCKTAFMIPDNLKLKIYEEHTANGMKFEELAHKYGIKVPRVEAIIKLQAIEQEWSQNNQISDDLSSFASTMYKMFPLYNPPIEAENLTEIPTPEKTLHQRFLTISESEPFGPVDAAKLFDLEPAQDTLKNLSEITDSSEAESHKLNQVKLGQQRQGDRGMFKFTHSKSGDVGFRYGASRRDRKKDRAIGFDNKGQMINLV